MGVDHRNACRTASGKRGPGVEAEPADPKERAADHGHADVMREHRLGVVPAPLADHERGNQSRDGRVDVHHGAAREVERACRGKVAAGTPYHVGDRCIDRHDPDGEEDHRGGELYAVGRAAEDDHGRDDRKGELEHHIDGFGNGRRQRRQGVRRDAHQHDAGEAAEEGIAFGEGQRIADRDPDHGQEARAEEALHQHGQRVLLRTMPA